MKTIRHEFETRLLRYGAAGEITPNASGLMQFVVISVIRVSVLPSYET